MKVGDKAVTKARITEEAISAFVKLSGDQNPIHTDESYAKNSMFGRRIAPGMMVASFISAVLANQLPGKGTIYLGQNLKFVKPVYLGDEISAAVEVKTILRSDRAEMRTYCINQDDELVIEGSAIVKFVPELP